MFQPNYEITHAILNALTHIAAAREVITNAHLVPRWAVSLRKEALIQSAHASTAIEGNPLTIEDVTELAQGRDIMAQRKAKQEVLNYIEVLEQLPKMKPRKEITEETILEMHRLLTKDVLDAPSDVGRYRDRQGVVANRFTKKVTFRPPPTKEVPGLMAGFVEWLNHRETLELDAVLEAGIAHYELVRIHPFVDGNGRLARALAALIFYRRGFDTNRFFALDDYYDSDRAAYYSALKSVDPVIQDTTQWMEYFTHGVALSVSAVRDRVLRLSGDRRKARNQGQVALTERQMRIIERIHSHGLITNRDVREMFGLSNRVALDEINKLLALGVVKTEGQGRNVRYVLA